MDSVDGETGESGAIASRGSVLPLPFQRTLLQNMLGADALLILARGLGLLTLLSHLLYIYDNPEVASPSSATVYKNLVVLIGAETREESLIGQNVAEMVTRHTGVGAGLQVINTDRVGVDQRCHVFETRLSSE